MRDSKMIPHLILLQVIVSIFSPKNCNLRVKLHWDIDMKCKTLILSAGLLWLFNTAGFAQNPVADSLARIISNGKDDTAKVNALIQVFKYVRDSAELATEYSLRARDLAQKLGYKKGLAYALKNLGLIQYDQGSYKTTITYWEQSLSIFQSIGDELGEANVLNNIGAFYADQGDDENALKNLLRSLQISEKLGDKVRIAEVLVNIGRTYGVKENTRDKAFHYLLQALPLCEELGKTSLTGIVTVNLGELYLSERKVDSSLYYFNKSLKLVMGTPDEAYTQMSIGKVYIKKGNYQEAINSFNQAIAICKKYDNKLDMASSLIPLGDAYFQTGQLKAAMAIYNEAQDLAIEVGANPQLKDAYLGLALSFAKSGDFPKAYKYQTLFSNIKDTLYKVATAHSVKDLQYSFDIEKKQTQIDLLFKDKALADLDLRRQKFTKNAFIVGFSMLFIIVFIIYRDYRNKIKTNKILDSQKAEIEHLLLNILPAEVAQELQRDGVATPRFYDSISVMFTDFKGFTKIADALSPQEVVTELNECFMAFDDVMEKYNLEKIKTIGDSYMCCGGFQPKDNTHPVRMMNACQEIKSFIDRRNQSRINLGLEPWEIRIGVHTGPVVAGVVGKKKYAYDIWGTTVNIASRMESNGAPGQINISADTYELVKDNFNCIYRGKIYAKNVGEIDMYFVNAGPQEKHVPETIFVDDSQLNS